MQLSTFRPGGWILFTIFSLVHAEQLIEANGLTACHGADNSDITINHMSATLTPGNNSVSLVFDGYSGVAGDVVLDVDLLVYGYKALSQRIDPCSLDLSVFCPMKAIELQIPKFTYTFDNGVLDQIPGIAYSVPDIDAVVRINLNRKSGGSVACLETRVHNGKTVFQAGVSWTLAIMTGLGLVASAVFSLLGHSNTATHLAFRSLAFLGFIQSTAMGGLLAVEIPPMAQSWIQDTLWSMGFVSESSLETISTWFQRATGGTPSSVLSEQGTVSVVLQKRATSQSQTVQSGAQIVLRGIKRAGARANITLSNIFMTGYLFYYFVTALVLACVGVALVIRFVLSKRTTSITKIDKATGATEDWKTVMRNTFFRLACIGYPQMCVLCLWELVEKDSAAEIVLAITMWLVTTAVLAFAAFKIFQRAIRSKQQHNTPAYTLYSDPATLNKWGFLYIYYRAPVYWFLVPTLVYIIIKGMLVAFGQSNGLAQSIVLLILELAMMLAIGIIKPFMTKGANVFAIIGAVLNSLNAIFFLVFSNVFSQPPLMTGILGVLYFIFNAAFTLALLIYLLVGIVFAVISKSPDSKYRALADDRDSFRWSRTGGTTELDQLEKVARGDDTEAHPNFPAAHTAPPSDEDVSMAARRPYNDVVDPSLPLFPSAQNGGRRSS
ncbi:uncharacterized protein N7511_010380 [Penicillium nucicola]|uniref:uncharacterized protein n=1 Tax=Penicillium nucicola TaxID=1850975 RepID=UPI002545B414|nr:uncharacterized protein N7511_010380 [Penicillium nucicola]KAJ5748684.1 hypothetical protein N7511_010380 [Penicillium nucicola]